MILVYLMQTEILKLETEINEELFKVCSWLAVNKLTLNIEKLTILSFVHAIFSS